MTIQEAKELFQEYDITEALEKDEPQDIISEIADNQVDIYNSDLLEWVKDNYNFVEDAIEEFGFPTDKEGKPDFLQAIRLGQYIQAEQELYEAWASIKKEV